MSGIMLVVANVKLSCLIQPQDVSCRARVELNSTLSHTRNRIAWAHMDGSINTEHYARSWASIDLTIDHHHQHHLRHVALHFFPPLGSERWNNFV